MNEDSRQTDSRNQSEQNAIGNGLSRRSLLVTGAATWAAVSFAGCSDNDEPDDTPTSTETANVTVTNTTTTTSTPGTETASSAPTPTPTETETETPTPTGTACTQSSIFATGQEIGFLAGVYDTLSGLAMGPDEVTSVRLEFEGELPDLELEYAGDHDEVAADEWGATLSDTESLEPGMYTYQLVVTQGGIEKRAADTFELKAF